MEKIAVLNTGYDSYEVEKQIFSENGFELAVFKEAGGDDTSRIGFARDAAGILVRDMVIDREALEQMPHLRAIVRYGVGFDNIDISAARKRGVRVANVQGYANHAVSDHALALLFACTRGIRMHRMEPFGKPGRPDMVEMHDKTLGIIGIGRIGSTFALKASPLFHRTLASDPYQTDRHLERHGATRADLETLLGESHVISLHCNLTDETRHMLNGSAFQIMKKMPVIINTARGAVIEEGSLLEALNNSLVHSAGLDVFEDEPPGERQMALLAHQHVVATPHVAWYSDAAMRELQRRAAENMVGLLTGREVSDELSE